MCPACRVRRFRKGSKLLEFARRHPQTNLSSRISAVFFKTRSILIFPITKGWRKSRAANLPNVFVDTSHHLMYVYPGVMQQVVDIFGADRLVFGTDMPLQGPMQARFAIEAIRALDIPESDKDKILFANAQKLLAATK